MATSGATETATKGGSTCSSIPRFGLPWNINPGVLSMLSN